MRITGLIASAAVGAMLMIGSPALAAPPGSSGDPTSQSATPTDQSDIPPGAVVAGPPTAHPDEGSFTWNANFSHQLYSRMFYADPGDLSITSYMDCDGSGVNSYTIQLEAIGWGYVQPLVYYPCNETGQFTWHPTLATYYEFILTKAQNGTYISGHGATYYQ